MNIQPEFSPVLAAIYLGLFVFGCFYNWGVTWAVRNKYTEGYMGFIVAFGVGITLLPFLFLGQVNVWWVYGAFVASGVPMILGDVWRYLVLRRMEKEHERQAARMAEHSEGS